LNNGNLTNEQKMSDVNKLIEFENGNKEERKKIYDQFNSDIITMQKDNQSEQLNITDENLKITKSTIANNFNDQEIIYQSGMNDILEITKSGFNKIADAVKDIISSIRVKSSSSSEDSNDSGGNWNNYGEKIGGSATGTNSHPGGMAVISEKGRELLIYPDGKVAISGNNGAEFTTLPTGTKVIPNKETEEILAGNKIIPIPGYANGVGDMTLEEKSLFQYSLNIELINKAIETASANVDKWVKEREGHKNGSDLYNEANAEAKKYYDLVLSYETKLKSTIKDRYDYEFSLIDKQIEETRKLYNIDKNLFDLDILNSTSPDNYIDKLEKVNNVLTGVLEVGKELKDALYIDGESTLITSLDNAKAKYGVDSKEYKEANKNLEDYIANRKILEDNKANVTIANTDLSKYKELGKDNQTAINNKKTNDNLLRSINSGKKIDELTNFGDEKDLTIVNDSIRTYNNALSNGNKESIKEAKNNLKILQKEYKDIFTFDISNTKDNMNMLSGTDGNYSYEDDNKSLKQKVTDYISLQDKLAKTDKVKNPDKWNEYNEELQNNSSLVKVLARDYSDLQNELVGLDKTSTAYKETNEKIKNFFTDWSIADSFVEQGDALEGIAQKQAEINGLIAKRDAISDKSSTAWIDLDAEITKLTQDIEDNQNKIIELSNTYADIKLSQLDNPISNLNNNISLLGDINTDDEYAQLDKYTNDIKDYLFTKKYTLQNEIDKWNAVLNDSNSTEEQKISAGTLVTQFTDAMQDVDLEIVSTKDKLENIISEKAIRNFDDSIKKFKTELSDLDFAGSLIDEDDVEGKLKNTLAKAIVTLGEINTIKDKIKNIDINNPGLSDEKRNELLEQWNSDLQESVTSFYNLNQEAEQFNFDKAIDGLNELKDVASKYHDEQIKNLDDELDAYNKNVEAKLKNLDTSQGTEDYDKELLKKQKDRNDIQRKYDETLLNNSYEAKSKRNDLTKELNEKDIEIEEFKLDRSRELQKQAINDQKDSFNDDIELRKTNLDDAWTLESEKWDKIIESVTNGTATFDEITNTWYGNVTAGLVKFDTEVTTYVNDITTAFESIGDIRINTPTIPSVLEYSNASSTSNNNNNPSDLNTNNINPQSLSEYLIIDDKYYHGETDSDILDPILYNTTKDIYVYSVVEGKFISSMTGKEYTGHATSGRKYKSGGLNTETGYHWLDGTPEEPEMVLDAHQTSAMLKLKDYLPNFLDVVKSFPTNLMNNFNLPNMNMSNILSNFTPANAIASSDTVYNLNLRIDNVTGDKNGGKTVFNEIVNGMKSMGKKI